MWYPNANQFVQAHWVELFLTRIMYIIWVRYFNPIWWSIKRILHMGILHNGAFWDPWGQCWLSVDYGEISLFDIQVLGENVIIV